MRLIDADRLKKDMEKESKNRVDRVIRMCSQLNEAGLRKLDEYIKMLLRMPEYRRSDQEIASWIDRQPTAYDVDKVVEELRAAGDIQFKSYSEPLITVGDAVRIVRAGKRG